LCDTEIEYDGLGMSDVQITVRLRRKAGGDTRVPPLGQILLDDLANEIGLSRVFFLGHLGAAVAAGNG